VFVQSSDKARAIVSAQSLLYGFFPPAAHEKFDNAINWHPIPVHCSGIDAEDPVCLTLTWKFIYSANFDHFQLLKPTKFACPTFDKEVVTVQKNFADELFTKNAEFYEFVRNQTGFKEFGLGELKSLSEVSKEVDHGMKQPEWLHKKWPKEGGKTTLDLVKGKFVENMDSFKQSTFACKLKYRVAKFSATLEMAVSFYPIYFF
jgi:hypothetical protein